MSSKYADTRYALVKVGGRYFYMQVEREMANGNLIGRRVRKDGSLWDKDDGKHWTQHMIVASPKNLIGYWKLNLYYGELEPANEK